MITPTTRRNAGPGWVGVEVPECRNREFLSGGTRCDAGDRQCKPPLGAKTTRKLAFTTASCP
jgi:hypothetical protein